MCANCLKKKNHQMKMPLEGGGDGGGGKGTALEWLGAAARSVQEQIGIHLLYALVKSTHPRIFHDGKS